MRFGDFIIKAVAGSVLELVIHMKTSLNYTLFMISSRLSCLPKTFILKYMVEGLIFNASRRCSVLYLFTGSNNIMN